MTRGDKGKLFSLFFPLFTLSQSQQDCVLPVVEPDSVSRHLTVLIGKQISLLISKSLSAVFKTDLDLKLKIACL